MRFYFSEWIVWIRLYAAGKVFLFILPSQNDTVSALLSLRWTWAVLIQTFHTCMFSNSQIPFLTKYYIVRHAHRFHFRPIWMCTRLRVRGNSCRLFTPTAAGKQPQKAVKTLLPRARRVEEVQPNKNQLRMLRKSPTLILYRKHAKIWNDLLVLSTDFWYQPSWCKKLCFPLLVLHRRRLLT